MSDALRVSHGWRWPFEKSFYVIEFLTRQAS